MYVHKIGSIFSAGARGPSMAASEDELFLANLPGPIGVGAGGQRWISGLHSLTKKDSADGLPRIRSRIGGGVAVGGAGSAMPVKSAAIGLRQTLTTDGTQFLTSSVTLDAERNTVYMLIRPGATTILRTMLGPVTAPASAAPTDDVLALSVGTDGQMRWVSDSGGSSLLIAAAAGDRRGVNTVIRMTMSPTSGKALLVDGYAEVRNASLVASLIHTDLQIFRFGALTGRWLGDLAELLILPGVDYSDPAYATVDTRVRAILAGWGGL